MYSYHSATLAGGPMWYRLVTASIGILLGSSFARAEAPPLLEFDVPFSISCRSLPLKNPTPDDPTKELVEVVIPISARMQAGTEKDLKHCLYTLVDTTKPETLTVTDLLPQTQLKTEYAKPIQVSKESLAKIGISLSAHYVVDAASDASGQLKSGVAYEMLPPQEIVLASGTLQHGHGVFFELKPSTQTTLEGIKSFSAIFAVPRGWRGGCLKLECEATGVDRGVVPPFDRNVNSGQAVFYLALYLAGDAEAERLADDAAKKQQALLESIVQRRLEVKAANHNVFSKVGHIGKWPWFFDKSYSTNEALPTTAEIALLNCVSDRTLRAKSMEEFPPAVLEKLGALQVAVETLQRLPLVSRPLVHVQQTMTNQDRTTKPASSTKTASENAVKHVDIAASNTAISSNFAELYVPDRQLSPGKPEPPKNLPVSPSTEKDKTNSVATVNPLEMLIDNRKKEETGTFAAPSLPLGANGSAVLPGSASVDNIGSTKSVFPFENPSNRGLTLQGFSSNQVWYLLISIWGALFTYIVAPLVVHFISKRTRGHHRHHRSRHKRAPLPPPADPSHELTQPVPEVIPPILVPRALHLRREGNGFVIDPDKDQNAFGLT